MKKYKVSIISFTITFLIILWNLLYPIVSDVALSDTKEGINTFLSSYLKPMSPSVYIPFILLVVSLIIFSYQLWTNQDVLKERIKELEGDNKELNRRVDNLTDERITKPQVRIVTDTKEQKIYFLEEKMKTFVNKEKYINGIQLYEYSVSNKDIRIGRVAEFIDDVSSWETISMKTNATIYKKFKLAKTNHTLKAFIESCKQHLNSVPVDNLGDQHIYEYALMKVAARILGDQGEQIYSTINSRLESQLFRLNKRIGIIEAILYIEETNPINFYIFQKRFGDREKYGRYYFNNLYTVNEQPHILLVTFEKEIKDSSGKGPIQEILKEKVEEFLTLLEN